MARDVIFTILCIDRASHAMEKIGRKTEETGAKFGVLGKAAGTGLAVLGVAAAAAAVEGVKLASTFQRSMTLLATTAGVAPKQVDQLSQAVLKLSAQVGYGPDSLAQSLYHIESSFASLWSPQERVTKGMQLLRTAAEGAKIGHADLVDTTNALGGVMAARFPDVKNYSQAMSELVAITGSGDMHMQDLAAAFTTGGLKTLQLYGVTLKDVGGALATFGDHQMRGQLAINNLRMAVMALALPVKGGAAELARLGLTSKRLASDMQTGGLGKGIEDLHKHLDAAGISGTKVGAELTQIFGRKAGTGISIMIGDIERFRSKYKELGEASGSFAQKWAQTQATFAVQWDQFKASMEVLLTELGLKLIPLLEKVLPPVLKGLGVAIDGFSGAWDRMVGGLQSVRSWLQRTFGDPSTTGHVNALKTTVVTAFHTIWDAVGPALQKIWTTIQTQVVPAFVAFVKALIPVVTFLVSHLAPVVRDVMKTVGAVINAALKMIAGVFNIWAGLFSGNWSRTWSGVKQIFSGAWDAIKAIFTGAVHAIGDILAAAGPALWAITKRIGEGIKAAFRALAGSMVQIGKDIVMGVVHGIQGAGGAAVDAIKSVGSSLVGGLAGAVGWSSPAKKFIPIGRGIIDGVTVGLRQTAPDAYAEMRSFALKIADIKVSPALKTSISKIADHIGSQMILTTTKVQELTKRIDAQKQAVADLFKKRAEYADQLASGASGGGITNIGLLKLDSQGRNADAQQKVDDAQTAATDATTKLADARQRLADLNDREAGREVTLTDQVAAARKRLADLEEQEAARTSNTIAQLQQLRDARQAVTDAEVKAADGDASTIAQLQQLRDARQAVTDAEVAAATSQQNLATASDAAKKATTNQATDYLDQLKARVRSIHTFSDDMNKLKAEGLSQDVLQQIANAGLETGGALARALAEQGTPQTIAGINAMSKQITASSARFGKTWAGDMYNTGINAANGMLKGLESKRNDLLALAREMARAVTAEINKVLAVGGGGGASVASTAASSAHTAHAAHVATVARGNTHVHVHMQSGFVGSPDQLATALSDTISRARSRGMLPARGTSLAI